MKTHTRQIDCFAWTTKMVGKNYDRLVLLIQCSAAIVVEINVDNLTGVNICAKKT